MTECFCALLQALVQSEEALLNTGLLADKLLVNLAELLHPTPPGADGGIGLGRGGCKRVGLTRECRAFGYSVDPTLEGPRGHPVCIQHRG